MAATHPALQVRANRTKPVQTGCNSNRNEEFSPFSGLNSVSPHLQCRAGQNRRGSNVRDFLDILLVASAIALSGEVSEFEEDADNDRYIFSYVIGRKKKITY